MSRHGRDYEPIATLETTFSPGYLNWVKRGARTLGKELHLNGDKLNWAVILGSGLNTLPDVMPFRSKIEIPESKLHLPVVPKMLGQEPRIVAGVTEKGRRVIMKSRNVHPYMASPLGVRTQKGVMRDVQLSTGFIHMLSLLGTEGIENLILSYAAGGIANPAFPGDEIKYPEIPALALLVSDMNMAYPSAAQGVIRGDQGIVFSGAREPDEVLIDAFQKTLQAHRMSPADLNAYATSPSMPRYENRAHILFLLLNGFRGVGMSAGPEMEILSLLGSGIKRILAIEVITNRVLLLPKGGNDVVLALRKKIKERCGIDIPTSELDEERLQRGLPLVPSRWELGFMEVGQLEKESETSHEEVDAMGKKMAIKLAPVVSDLIETFSN